MSPCKHLYFYSGYSVTYDRSYEAKTQEPPSNIASKIMNLIKWGRGKCNILGLEELLDGGLGYFVVKSQTMLAIH